jgi:hypothetical protein
MILCDLAITEQGTNKKTLVGIFQRVQASVFPIHQQMFIYVQLTDAQGIYVFKLEAADIDRDITIGTVNSDPIELPDRLVPVDFVFPVTIAIPAPGLYEFRLYANDAFLSSISFTAHSSQP